MSPGWAAEIAFAIVLHGADSVPGSESEPEAETNFAPAGRGAGGAGEGAGGVTGVGALGTLELIVSTSLGWRRFARVEWLERELRRQRFGTRVRNVPRLAAARTVRTGIRRASVPIRRRAERTEGGAMSLSLKTRKFWYRSLAAIDCRFAKAAGAGTRATSAARAAAASQTARELGDTGCLQRFRDSPHLAIPVHRPAGTSLDNPCVSLDMRPERRASQEPETLRTDDGGVPGGS